MNKKEISEATTREINRKKVGLKCSVVGIIANLCLASAKLIIGLISHSIAILFDVTLRTFPNSSIIPVNMAQLYHGALK